MIRQRVQKSLAQIPYLLRALGFVWEAAGAWTITWVAVLAAQGLLPVASVYLTRYLVNQLVAATEAGFSAESLRMVIALWRHPLPSEHPSPRRPVDAH